MFGDIGHGLIVTVFAAWMVCKEKQLMDKNDMAKDQSEIWEIMFAGRYVILLLGIFSIYTGFIYNDMFSKSFNIFGSQWRVKYNRTYIMRNNYLQLDPKYISEYLGSPYIMGVDPVWDAAGEHAIIMSNSMKMKLAIIFGVSQMLFGLILSALNCKNLKNYVDLYLNIFPQLLFMLCLFFYLVFLIFFKWVNYGGHFENQFGSACAPSILISFIDMVLLKESKASIPSCSPLMYSAQITLQHVLLFTALACIPIMLLGKPLFFLRKKMQITRENDLKRQEQMLKAAQDNIKKSLMYKIEKAQMTSESFGRKTSDESIFVDHQINEQDKIINMGDIWIHQG